MDKTRDERHRPRLQFFGTYARSFRYSRENRLDSLEAMFELMDFLRQIAHMLGVGRGTVLGEPDYGPDRIHKRHWFILFERARDGAIITSSWAKERSQRGCR